MRSVRLRRASLVAILFGAACALTLLGLAAQAPPPEVPPAEAPPPQAPPAAEAASPAPSAPELPRIIRVVCTDRLCGNCDGKCHRQSGHVAVDKKGHCACTPTEGSSLDRAIRQAYEKRTPQ